MHILVTRPAEPAARTAARLAALGHEPLLDPVLTLEFAPPEHLIGEVPPDAVVLTSANGVRALEGHADLASLVVLPLWTVGTRTSEAARGLGFVVMGEAEDLKGLADLLGDRPAPLRLLHIAGEHRAGDLGELLALAGHVVETRVVYRAARNAGLSPETQAALGEGSLNAVLHYSRRSAESFIALAAEAGLSEAALQLRHLCLSNEVASPLRTLGAADVLVAETPNEDALLALLGEGGTSSSARQPAEEALDSARNGEGARAGMAEPGNPGSGPKASRTKTNKPKPQVIDLEATEIDREPPPSTPDFDVPPDPPSEPDAPQAGDPPPPPPLGENDPMLGEEPRSSLGALVAAGLIGAALAIVGLMLLLSAELVPFVQGPDRALGSRLSAIESRLETLAATPPAPAPAAAEPAAPDPELANRVDELSRGVEELRNRPETPAAAAPADTARLEAIEARMNEIGAKADNAAQAAAESRASAAAFEQLAGRVDQLAARVDELAATAAQQRQPDPAIQESISASKRASALAALASLEAAVARGVPYAPALGAVRAQLPGVELSALDAGAEKGLPSLPEAGRKLAADLEAAPPPAPEAANGMMDRLISGARGLVRVKPAGDSAAAEPVGDDPWTVRSRMAQRLSRGAYDEALAEWEKLDTAAKEATTASGDVLRARLAADRALDAARAEAIKTASTETQP